MVQELNANSILLTSKELRVTDEPQPTRNEEGPQTDMSTRQKLLVEMASAINTGKDQGIIIINSQDGSTTRNDPQPPQGQLVKNKVQERNQSAAPTADELENLIKLGCDYCRLSAQYGDDKTIMKKLRLEEFTSTYMFVLKMDKTRSS